mmetsp:Transcript_21247/g.45853  ORF Transcript_21247/g.45853 Transcript_21247/m.45853 type:complete len:430 (-) Transcript_21247:3257-4546(-)
MQKSLARALVRCRNRESKRIGVEILEASVYDLNAYNMRRTYQFGRIRYDPGRYAKMRARPGQSVSPSSPQIDGNDDDDGSESGPADVDEFEEEAMNVEQSEREKGGKEARGRGRDRGGKYGDETIVATDEDELDAPWNQYAWIEEMQIRIAGLIPFGAPTQRSSTWSRYIFGDAYRRTVPSARGPIRRILPSFLTGNKWGDDGIDGDYGRGRGMNRASAKPHAVVANGAAMQRVPGSLRHLTKCCREADVPLFIINDPRVWGGNTHSDLESAADDIRRAIKARVVVNALNIKEGSMYQRGRLVGQLETEARWLRKDMGRRTRQAVRDAQSRLRKERESDWSKLDEDDLADKLVERQVIKVSEERIRDKSPHSENKGHQNIESLSDGFIALCRRYQGYSSRNTAEKPSNDSSNEYAPVSISDPEAEEEVA